MSDKDDVRMQEKARGLMAQQRQHEEHLQQTMHSRSSAELETSTEAGIWEEAREELTSQRQHDENLQQNMHSRLADETVASS